MALSSEHWCFGRAHATGNLQITILSYWRENDPASNEEQETQVIQCVNGQVFSTFVPFHCVDVLDFKVPRPHTLVVGLEGDVAIIENGKLKLDFLDESDDGPRGRGDIRSLAQVENQTFAVGMQGQVYLREPLAGGVDAAWKHYEKGISWSPLEMSGFNALGGFSSDELYAAGWRGGLMICEQGIWRSIEMPTNLKLERLLVAPDNNVYLAGIKGVLLRGRRDSFEVIQHGITEDPFWGLCWAFGSLWLATANKLFRLVEDSLEEVNPNLGEDLTCRCLTAEGGKLWSVGSDHVVFTEDGQNWKQVFF